MTLNSHNTPPENSGPEQGLGNQLRTEESGSRAEASRVIAERLAKTEKWVAGEPVQNNLGIAEYTGTDRGRAIYNTMLRIYQVKAEELTNELKRLEGIASEPYILETQKILLGSIRSRMSLVMAMNTPNGDSMSTSAEMQNLIRNGVPLLSNMNVPALLAGHLKEPAKSLYLKKLEQDAGKIVPDYFAMVERISNSNSEAPLTDKDWAIIVDNLKMANQNGGDWMRRSMTQGLLAVIPSTQRVTLIEKLWGAPGFKETLQGMVVSSYVTVAQATSVVEDHLKILAQNPAKNQKEIQDLGALLTRLQGEGTTKLQAAVQDRLKQDREGLNRGTFGQFNSTRQLMTTEGVLGSLLAINGGIGMGLNLFAEIMDPSKVLENEGFQMSTAMFLGGMQLNDGFGHLVSSPTEVISNVAHKVQSGEKEVNMEKAAQEKELLSELGRYPKVAEFYVNFAEEINQAYDKKRRENPLDTHAKISLQDLGMDFKKLPEPLRELGEEKVNAVLSQWVDNFNTEDAWKNKGAAAQINVIEHESRVKHDGLKPFSRWDKKTKTAMRTILETPKK